MGYIVDDCVDALSESIDMMIAVIMKRTGVDRDQIAVNIERHGTEIVATVALIH